MLGLGLIMRGDLFFIKGVFFFFFFAVLSFLRAPPRAFFSFGLLLVCKHVLRLFVMCVVLCCVVLLFYFSF